MDRLETLKWAEQGAKEEIEMVSALSDSLHALLKEACTDEQEVVRRLKIILLTDALDSAKEG